MLVIVYKIFISCVILECTSENYVKGMVHFDFLRSQQKHINISLWIFHQNIQLFFQGLLESPNRFHRGNRTRMKRYLSDFWNQWDLLSHALLIAALFVRHFYIDETFTIARRMFALSLLVMYLRFLEVFLMFRKIGLTIIMIKEMVKCLILRQMSLIFVLKQTVLFYFLNNTNHNGLLFTWNEEIWISEHGKKIFLTIHKLAGLVNILIY